MAKTVLKKKMTLFTSKLNFNLRIKLVKRYVWNIALMKVGHFGKYIRNTRTWKDLKCGVWEGWRSVDRSLRNEVRVLQWIKHERNIIKAIKRRKANWIGHIFRRKCLLNQSIEGKIEGRIEGRERRRRRLRQLLGNLQEKRGYWKLKEDALYLILWRTRFGRGMYLS